MSEMRLRYALGCTLVALHVGLFLVAGGLFFTGGFSFDQFTTTIAIIVPVFAGYATSVVAFVIKDRFRTDDNSARVSGVFIVLSFFYPTVFFGILVGVMWLQTHSLVFANFEQFKMTITLVEGAFAIYVSSFVYSLFERSKSKPKRRQPRPLSL